MARINIEEKWWSDPRRKQLIKLVGSEELADGICINFWRLAQSYVQDDRKAVIPDKVFQALSSKTYLTEANLTEKHQNGFYVVGSEELMGWLANKRQNGRKGGLKRAAQAASKTEMSQAKPSKRKQTQPSSSDSSSYSYSTSDSEEFNKSQILTDPMDQIPSGGVLVWNAYRESFKARYGVEPVRNAKVNGQCSQIHKRLGADAVEVVKFYLSHNDGYYLRNQHPLGGLLTGAEGLHAQWQRGTPVTAAQVRQVEKTIGMDEWLQQLEAEEMGKAELK
jgi:hypothetical protein